ncbi:TRAP transporter large permease subunit [Paenalcaligenes niemegkensis]|uniref:TRAP transporter large permease n=1 Tax=Paenalcaligenes niemegkensis TaxID=2895469 RepID=UPI001EE86218|nr:TRAP transporter large permease subunit [Paenalcaligenes niemegkensis]MCQ9617916.1 TRAP transporter large permease subunit [Paenalcaligenes niemegkensis]
MTYLLPSLMLITLIVGIFSGYPVAFLLGGLSVLFMFLGDVPLASFSLVTNRVFGSVLENWILAAIPLFVFMGVMLDKSKIADNLLLELEKLFRGRPGGLGLAVIIIGLVMAASTGIIGASVVLMGTLALPLMLKRNYDKTVAIGTILGSGTLGILLPPSIMLVVFGDVMQVPVGDLFAATLVPGMMLASFYVLYIIYNALFHPHKVPANEAGDAPPMKGVLLRVLRDLVVPALLISSVLLSIVLGIATPTEGAAIGAGFALLLALAKRKLSLSTLLDSLRSTARTTGMILFLAIGATAYSLIFKRLGGQSMIEDIVASFGVSPYMVVLGIMVLIFVLGFFLEWIEISFLVLPLFAPVVAGLDFGDSFASQGDVLIWFAVLVAVNLQTSFLTPPFGYAVFYLKGIAPSNISTMDIYKGVVPIVGMQLFGVLIIALFPAIVLWLPKVL